MRQRVSFEPDHFEISVTTAPESRPGQAKRRADLWSKNEAMRSYLQKSGSVERGWGWRGN